MPDKGAAQDLQAKKFEVLKPIVYKNPDSPLYRQTVTPGQVKSLTFPHLPDADINLLVKMKYLGEPGTLAKRAAAAGAGKKQES